MKQMIQLLKKTIQERNEARDQLDQLVNKLVIPSAKPTTEILSAMPRISPKNPLVKPTRANSSNMAFMNHEPFVQDYNVPSVVVKVDQGSLIINNLVKGKTMPQKGNLVQSVLGAGLLL
ncbi:hypothetical protein AgCh_022260 [Apium graveolens]